MSEKNDWKIENLNPSLINSLMYLYKNSDQILRDLEKGKRVTLDDIKSFLQNARGFSLDCLVRQGINPQKPNESIIESKSEADLIQ